MLGAAILKKVLKKFYIILIMLIFSDCFIVVGITLKPEPITGRLGAKQDYILDLTLVLHRLSHSHDHTLIHT